jgi:conjugative transposon TraN protein
MKKLIICFVLLLATIAAFSQSSQHLPLSDVITTVLVFPAPICEGGVDRGHPDIVTSQVSGMSNVLRVKATSASMPHSNLTVFTTDGRIYSFTTLYNGRVQSEPVYVSAESVPAAQFATGPMTESTIAYYAEIIRKSWTRSARPRTKATGRMRMGLSGIYQKEDLLFFKFWIDNTSNIDYDFDFSRMYIRDQKVPRRTAIMEKPVEPVFQLFPPSNKVEAGTRGVVVFALKRFTIADNKFFVLEMFEENGDRPLILKIKGKYLLEARRE